MLQYEQNNTESLIWYIIPVLYGTGKSESGKMGNDERRRHWFTLPSVARCCLRIENVSSVSVDERRSREQQFEFQEHTLKQMSCY